MLMLCESSCPDVDTDIVNKQVSEDKPGRLIDATD